MEQRRLITVEQKSETTTWLVLTMIKLIIFGLLLACLLAPLIKLTDSDDQVVRGGVWTLLGTIGDEAYHFGEDLGSRDEIPTHVTIGLLVTRVGAVVWCLGLLAVGATTLELINSAERRDKIMVRASAVVLLLGTGLLALGLRWLPFHRDDQLGPAWGLLLPAFAAVWVLVLHVRSHELGETLADLSKNDSIE